MSAASPPLPPRESSSGHAGEHRNRADGSGDLVSLSRVLSRIAASLDVPETLAAALEAARQTLAADAGSIRLYDEETAHLTLAASAGLTRAEEALLPLRVPLTDGSGFSARVARERSPLCLGRIEAPTPYESTVYSRLGLASVLCVPMVLKERLLGTLLVGARRIDAFGPDHVELAEGMARVVATALDRAALQGKMERLVASALQAKARADTLAAIGRALASALDPSEVLDLIAEKTFSAVRSAACAILRWDTEEQSFRPVAARGLSERYLQGFFLPRRQGVSGLVLQTGLPVWSADLLSDSRFQFSPDGLELMRQEGICGILAAPIASKGEFFGTLVTYRREPHEHTDEEVRFQAAVADQAAVAIERARLFQREREAGALARQQGSRAAAVAQIAKAFCASLDLDEVLSLLVERAAAATGAAAAAVLEREPAADVLRVRRARGLSSGYTEALVVPSGMGLAGAALATGRPQWTADILSDPRIQLPEALRSIIGAEGIRGFLAVPIPGGKEAYGVLNLYRRNPHDFDEGEIAFAVQIADQAAIAIANARLYRQAQERTDRLRALADITAAVSGSLDPRAVLDLVVDRVCLLMGVSRSAVAIAEEKDGEETLRFVALRGLSQDFAARVRVTRPRRGTMGTAFATRRPAWSADILNDPDFDLNPDTRAAIEAEGYRAVLSVPLLAGERAVGVLVVYRGEPGPFSADEVGLLQVFAGQAAIAIENARLFQQEQTRRRQLEAVRAITEEITRELDLPTLLELINRRAAELLGMPSGVVFLRDASSHLLQPYALHGHGEWARGIPGRLGTGLVGLVAQRRQGMIVNDYRTSPHAHPMVLEHSSLTAILAEPLLYGDRLLGVIVIDNEGTDRIFREEDQQLLALFAGQAAIAIENARLYEQTRAALQELAALHEAGRGIVESLDLQVTLGRIAEAARQLAGADRAFVWLVDEADRSLQAGIAVGPGAEAFLGTRISADSPAAAARAAREGRPIAVPDALDPSTADPALSCRFGNAALLAIPLRLQEAVPGVLVCGYNHRQDFTPAKVQRLSGLAQQGGIAIQNARLYLEEQERRRQLEAVRAVTEEITRQMELPALLGLIAQRASELVGVPSGAVFLWDEAAKRLVPRAWTGLGHYMSEVSLGLGESITGIVAQRRRGMIVNDYRTWSEASPIWIERSGITACVAEPLLYGDRLLGVITINNEGPGKPFAERDRQTLALFAGQAAIAIENARLYAEACKACDDLRAAQEQILQIEKLKALGEMAGGVAHDFNNMLAAILGQAQLLGLRTADRRVHDGLKVIERSALDGAETVRRILGFARVGSGADYVPVDVEGLLTQVLEVTRPRWKDEAQGRGTAIEAALALEPVPPLRGNPAELREVLVNLVFNAVDAMPAGGRITMGARRLHRPARAGGAVNPHRQVLADQAEETEELVEIFVRDTGVGMPDEVRRRAFDPFFTTKGVQGTGLGLSVVYGIVSRHGGEVLLESREGAGTTVVIRLPAATEPAAGSADAIPPTPARPGRIVVVDDEAALAQVLAEILRMQGHAVEAFTDPRLALGYLAREPVDLLFTDLGMPDMSGWEVAAQARAARADLPVVLITGWGHQIDPGRVRQARLRAVVAKPYRVQDILHVVAEILPATPTT